MQFCQTGKLIVKPTRANLTRKTDLFGKMDPYVKIEMGSQNARTKAHDNAGKQPSWFDVFEFNRTNEDVINFSLYDDDIGKDELIGSGSIHLASICVPGGKNFSDSINLKYKDENAGELYLEIQFYPNK
eukprot:TRINITY_DN7358_c0_g1_i2.p3 TRINITY_DN7358_c0_g1~~TRINITY_DN7358_c0_g1_i2.p3  ORF type:complete len:129 (+),score=46.59 TRINITY_DN7358_c0_g1_i2:149-535(+)